MEQHNSSEKPLFDNGMCGQYLESMGVDSKENQYITASGKKVTDKEMMDLMEDTLVKQRQGNAVHDEDSDEEPELKEVEDIDNEFLSGSREPFEEDEAAADRYADRYSPATGDAPEPFEEQLDPRWFRDEYLLLNEDVDWDKIEGDPKQLFTAGNSKVALDTIIFNLQPARFCPSLANGMCQIVQPDEKTGEFKIACYAYQDERQYDVALQLRLRQMRFWDTHSAEDIYKKLEEYYHDKKVRGDSLVYALGRAKKDAKGDKPAHPARYVGKPAKGMPGLKTVKLKYIRFNQSGDLKDLEDAEKMDKVAELAFKNLGLVSYTYTARKDILAKHKFQYVHVQGSGFSAITGLNKSVDDSGSKKSLGKVFKAFPSLYNKKHKFVGRDPKYKGLYYEDIFEKLTPEGQPNPKYDKYMKINPSGWYPCPGDCNSCPACKMDKFKNIAVKIHRAFQRIAGEWHDVEKVGAKGYRVHQAFDPYERDEKGKPVKWSQEMEKEYEGRVEKLRKQKEFSKLPKVEKEKTARETLEQQYKIFDPEMSDLEGWKKIVKKWEDKIKKHKLNVPFAQMRKQYGVPENRAINKLTKEDIDKYATEEEKEFLK